MDGEQKTVVVVHFCMYLIASTCVIYCGMSEHYVKNLPSCKKGALHYSLRLCIITRRQSTVKIRSWNTQSQTACWEFAYKVLSLLRAVILFYSSIHLYRLRTIYRLIMTQLKVSKGHATQELSLMSHQNMLKYSQHQPRCLPEHPPASSSPAPPSTCARYTDQRTGQSAAA